MNRKLLIAFASTAVLLTGCAKDERYIDTNKQTQLQIRQFQTRTFDAPAENDVVRALIDAFQDEGYIIKNAVPNVGLVVASKEKDVTDDFSAAMQMLFAGDNARYDKHMIEEVTGNVTPYGKCKYKVRLVIQEKVSNNQGGVSKVGTIGDPTVYQRIFTKVDKALFLVRQNI